jgi:hypothetical protein
MLLPVVLDILAVAARPTCRSTAALPVVVLDAFPDERLETCQALSPPQPVATAPPQPLIVATACQTARFQPCFVTYIRRPTNSGATCGVKAPDQMHRQRRAESDLRMRRSALTTTPTSTCTILLTIKLLMTMELEPSTQGTMATTTTAWCASKLLLDQHSCWRASMDSMNSALNSGLLIGKLNGKSQIAPLAGLLFSFRLFCRVGLSSRLSQRRRSQRRRSQQRRSLRRMAPSTLNGAQFARRTWCLPRRELSFRASIYFMTPASTSG